MLAKLPTMMDHPGLRALADERAKRAGSINAEIEDGATSAWYLVRTFPGDDLKALRWLARRRFGVFRPMQQRRIRRAGERLVQGWEPAFPGWLFVLCWDVEKMRSRISTCPGVMGLLCDPTSNKAVPIEDDFIDRLRALAWLYDDRAPIHLGQVMIRARRNVRRIGKQQRRTLDKLKKTLKSSGRWDSSTWEAANERAPHERIALLQRTLNAPPL